MKTQKKILVVTLINLLGGAATVVSILLLQACSNKDTRADKSCDEPLRIEITEANVTNAVVAAKNGETELKCKLTTDELRKRKETVIASLKSEVIERKELPNGYSFKFQGSDKIVDELAEFVKSERSCCSYFVFNLSFGGDGREAWLTLTGPQGTKEMITTELGL